MAKTKKENNSENKETNRKETETTNEVQQEVEKKGRATPFLFIATWAVVGALVFMNNQYKQTISYLVTENETNGDKINNLEVENKVLIDKIEGAERKIDKLSIDMQVFAEKYSAKEEVLAQNDELKTDDGDGLDDDFSEFETGEETKEAKIEEHTKTTSNKLSPEEYEQLAYDSQAISAGLTDVSDRTAFLEEKIDIVSEKLEQAKLNNYSNSLILSAVKLREAVNNSVSYESELNAFKFFAGEASQLQEEISVLEARSKNGITTLDGLKNDFSKISDEILNVSRTSKESPTVMDQVAVKLSNIVQIRKVDAQSGGTEVDDIIARARKALNEADVEKAVKEARSLIGDSKVLITPWLEQASSYVESKNAAEEIFVHVSNKAVGVEG